MPDKENQIENISAILKKELEMLNEILSKPEGKARFGRIIRIAAGLAELQRKVHMMPPGKEKSILKKQLVQYMMHQQSKPKTKKSDNIEIIRGSNFSPDDIWDSPEDSITFSKIIKTGKLLIGSFTHGDLLEDSIVEGKFDYNDLPNKTIEEIVRALNRELDSKKWTKTKLKKDWPKLLVPSNKLDFPEALSIILLNTFEPGVISHDGRASHTKMAMWDDELSDSELIRLAQKLNREHGLDIQEIHTINH